MHPSHPTPPPRPHSKPAPPLTPAEHRAALARLRELLDRVRLETEPSNRAPDQQRLAELERLAARVIAYEATTEGKGGPDLIEEAQVRREKLSPPAGR